MSKKRYDKILNDLYCMLYEAATPSADFEKLMKDASTETVDGVVKKVIPYDDYYLSIEDYEKIIKQIEVKYRLKPYERRSLRIEAFLGSGPSSYKK